MLHMQPTKMIIDKRTEQCVYITIGDWVIYIDDSTGEKIIETWKECECEASSAKR